ncbi:MAG: phosphomannomutase [Alteromonadaceae bacterium]|nr:phosphomannomutase [Alteromonadaceae bacterium]
MTAQTAGHLIADSDITFGTSGARGLVEQFSDEVCAAFATAFLQGLKHQFRFTKVAIGIDRRPSSPQMAAACAGAAKALGLEAEYFGVLPTPALALHAMAEHIPAIMITGSHIPFDRNGIKFYRPDGEISKADEQSIAASTAQLPAYTAELPAESPQATQRYINRYTHLYPAHTLAGMRIGVYQHSAAGRDTNTHILEQLGATVIPLGRTEEFVPIDTEAVTQDDKARGRAWAEEHNLHAIFSTDGDGDRPLLADESGQWLRGDILGLLCAQALGIEALAVPVSCNTAIERSDSFKEIKRTRIGSPFVIEAMAELAGTHQSIAGFEANGGFLLGSALNAPGAALQPLPTRDAILPALVVLAKANQNKRPVSALISNLPERYTDSDRLKDFATEQSQALIRQWKEQPEAMQKSLDLPTPIHSIDTTDGLRATLADGRIVHVRPSGNAPELRCYCEAETPSAVSDLLRHCMERLGKQGKPVS